MSKKKNSFMQMQPPMLKTVYALIPVGVAGIYYFGWRFLAVLALVTAVGILTEYLMARTYGMKVTSSVLVTSFLFSLSLPPTVPLWIAVVGIVFGIVFGKMVFGGFGKNIFNPAISGRAFIYISFGVPLTGKFVDPVSAGAAGGFAAWMPEVDAASTVTPLVEQAQGEIVPLADLFFGSIRGSFGETCALLIILGGVYIVWKKAANWRFIVSTVIAFLLVNAALFYSGVSGTVHPLYALFSGSFLFGAVFMVTDPVSASQTTDLGRWIYGFIVGALTVLIRVFSGWPEGITFAILFGNMFAPLIDHIIKERKQKRKAASA
ncbi:MAG: RnfABCDGE type electron transport complex subunit D [Spirochaetia bacterium]